MTNLHKKISAVVTTPSEDALRIAAFILNDISRVYFHVYDRDRMLDALIGDIRSKSDALLSVAEMISSAPLVTGEDHH